MAEEETEWEAEVIYETNGVPYVKYRTYIQNSKPDRTMVIRDIVPTGSTTTSVSITKV